MRPPTPYQKKTQFPKHLPQTQTTTTPTIPLESSHLKVGTDLACKGCKACRLLNVASMAGAKNSRFCGGLRDGRWQGGFSDDGPGGQNGRVVFVVGQNPWGLLKGGNRWCKGDVGNVCLRDSFCFVSFLVNFFGFFSTKKNVGWDVDVFLLFGVGSKERWNSCFYGKWTEVVGGMKALRFKTLRQHVMLLKW